MGIIVFVIPFSTSACNVKPYAKNYIQKINKVFGGVKPKLVVLSGKEDYYGFYESNTIYIYSGDYKGSCSSNTPFLKSVIAHEYAHSISSKLKKISTLRGEKLAEVAEHSIGDNILGNAEYDNEADSTYFGQYQKINNLIADKMQIKGLALASSSGTYLKLK